MIYYDLFWFILSTHRFRILLFTSPTNLDWCMAWVKWSWLITHQHHFIDRHKFTHSKRINQKSPVLFNLFIHFTLFIFVYTLWIWLKLSWEYIFTTFIDQHTFIDQVTHCIDRQHSAFYIWHVTHFYGFFLTIFQTSFLLNIHNSYQKQFTTYVSNIQWNKIKLN